jgi:hypothetical protein
MAIPHRASRSALDAQHSAQLAAPYAQRPSVFARQAARNVSTCSKSGTGARGGCVAGRRGPPRGRAPRFRDTPRRIDIDLEHLSRLLCRFRRTVLFCEYRQPLAHTEGFWMAAPKVSVVHYSSTGTVHALANEFAAGAEKAGAGVRVLPSANSHHLRSSPPIRHGQLTAI